MSDVLRNRLWNVYCCEIFPGLVSYNTNYLGEIMNCIGITYNGVFDIDDAKEIKNNLRKVKDWFEVAEWYQVYDFIEIYLNLLSNDERKDATENINAVLKSENAGYRVVGFTVIPITNDNELSCISEAQCTPYDSVNSHISKAAELFSKRPLPDYENSIKESISAVEAMCCIITGESGTNATLGNTIKKLTDKGVHIHKAMVSAYSSLYGYTSDEDGIRHGGIDFTNAPAEDAKYMLVSCSAFVNYLIEKWSKVESQDS